MSQHRIFVSLVTLCAAWMAQAADLQHFERMQFNNPGLEVELSLGIWPQPSVYDYDGDGTLDLCVKASGAPMKGSKRHEFCRLYRNIMKNSGACPQKSSGSVPNFSGSVPKSAGSVPRGEDIPATKWRSSISTWPGRSPINLAGLPKIPHPRKGEGRALYHADFDGDGLEDVLVMISDWTNYGKVGPGCTQTAYDAKGCWTNSIIETYAYFLKGPVPRKFGSVPKSAGSVPKKLGSVPNWVQVRCEGSDRPFLEGPFGGHKLFINDFDGDGDLDFIAAEFVDSFWYFENVGKQGEFKLAKGRKVVDPKGEPIGVDLCMYEPCWVDLNGDGRLDILSAEEDGAVGWFENTGKVTEDRIPIFKPHPHFREQAQELKFGCLSTPFGIDWDGDGDWDFIAGNSAGYIAFIENLSGPGVERPKWAAPKLLQVKGKPIRTMAGWTGSVQGPSERKWGYSGVSCGDWDGDGILDVIANDINGDVLFYRGRKRGGIEFAAAEGVEVEWKNGRQPQPAWEWRPNPGKRLRAPWRTTAEIFDFNADGLLDLVVMDHEGYLCVFERYRDRAGQLRLKHPKRAFVDEKGNPIRLNAQSAGAGGRSRFRLADWTGDGEFDMLDACWNAVLYEQIGMQDGKRIFRRDDWIGEEALQGHTCCPTVVDFDGNGILDGVISAEDGYFYYVRNARAVAKPRVKIIADGWDVMSATPQQILEQADAFDRSGFDGLFFSLEDTRKLPTSPDWAWDKFDRHLPTVRAFARHKGLKESLIYCRFTPDRRLDWFDRKAWERFAHNAAVLARFAKNAGLKGLSDDNEDYPHSRQWFFNAEKDIVTYNEVAEMAREYGELVGKAMFREYPEMVLLSSWHLSGDHSYFRSSDPAAKMREQGDVWPAFVEGLVRACPPTGKLVDGNEEGYRADAENNGFYLQSWDIKRPALQLLKPENRDRYLETLSVSFGIYPDMCVNSPDDTWYAPPGPDGTRITRFNQNLTQAAKVAEDYLWVYGEQGLVVPWLRDTKRFKDFKTWEELLPGYTVAIRAQSEPEVLASEALAASDGNLLTRKPITWQHPKRVQGTFKLEDGLWSATGVEFGCLILEAPATPGRFYAVGVEQRGNGMVTVTWKNQGKLLNGLPRAVLETRPVRGGWRRGVATICVPTGVDRIALHMELKRQRPDETTYFRNARAVEIR